MKQDQLSLEKLYGKVNESFLSPRVSPEIKKEHQIAMVTRQIHEYIQAYNQKNKKGSLYVSDLVKQYCLTNSEHVNQSLDIFDTPIDLQLPEGFIVHDCFYLDGLTITSLPKNLTVKNRLELYYSTIDELPEGLHVGDLDLKRCTINKMGNNTTVDRSVWARGCTLKALPAGLSVGETLGLTDSSIETLSRDLRVGRYLILSNSPISQKYDKRQIAEMVPNVKPSQIIIED